MEVLTLIARGLSTDGIAAELFVSPTTVRAHVRNILDTLGARNRAHAVAIACSTGLLWIDDDVARRHLPHAPDGAQRNGRPGAGGVAAPPCAVTGGAEDRPNGRCAAAAAGWESRGVGRVHRRRRGPCPVGLCWSVPWRPPWGSEARRPSATVFERVHYAGTEEFSDDGCGFPLDIVSSFRGQALLRIDKSGAGVPGQRTPTASATSTRTPPPASGSWSAATGCSTTSGRRRSRGPSTSSRPSKPASRS